LGPEHDEVVTISANLATLYTRQGKYREAEQLLSRALTITEKVLGPEHPSVANRLNNLAFLYHKQGRYG